jgi:hypothetical protein
MHCSGKIVVRDGLFELKGIPSHVGFTAGRVGVGAIQQIEHC